MRLCVSTTAGCGINEIVAAVEDDPLRIVQMCGEIGDANEGGKHGVQMLPQMVRCLMGGSTPL